MCYVSPCKYVRAEALNSRVQKLWAPEGCEPPRCENWSLQIPNAHFKILVMFYYCNLNSILIKPSSLYTLEQVPCPLHTWVFFFFWSFSFIQMSFGERLACMNSDTSTLSFMIYVLPKKFWCIPQSHRLSIYFRTPRFNFVSILQFVAQFVPTALPAPLR